MSSCSFEPPFIDFKSFEGKISHGWYIVTNGELVQCAYYDGNNYIGCSFRQENIIAQCPISLGKIPEKPLSPEQHAILSIDDRLRRVESRLKRQREIRERKRRWLQGIKSEAKNIS